MSLHLQQKRVCDIGVPEAAEDTMVTVVTEGSDGVGMLVVTVGVYQLL